MLSVLEADRLVSEHLGTTSRAVHSRVVAQVMRLLAHGFAADADLWEVVGLCHDLDFFATRDDGGQHGLVTIAWLGDRLPAEALDAIAAHDHRTGVNADTRLADMLKLADVVAVIDARLGRGLLLAIDERNAISTLRSQLADRPYLCAMLERYTQKHALSVASVLKIVRASPAQ
jgi:predicted hydrolase (HD superfamily)